MCFCHHVCSIFTYFNALFILWYIRQTLKWFVLITWIIDFYLIIFLYKSHIFVQKLWVANYKNWIFSPAKNIFRSSDQSLFIPLIINWTHTRSKLINWINLFVKTSRKSITNEAMIGKKSWKHNTIRKYSNTCISD